MGSQNGKEHKNLHSAGTHYYYYTVPVCVFPEWELDLTPIVVEPFLQPTGPAVQMRGDPADMFAFFFKPDIISRIVEETNRYAAQCLRGLQRSWTTDDEEVRAYLGFYILMGLV